MAASSRSFRRLIALAAIAIAASVLYAPVAQAGPLISSATGCDEQTLEQPFLPWADPASYVLAPDGGLESGGAGWTLAGGATIVSGNESYDVGSASDSRALSLPGGSSGTTASICVGIEHPDLRIFARNDGSPFSTLRVEVLYEDAAGQVQSLQIGRLGAGSSWQPSVQMPLVVNLLPLLPGERTAVALRFTPQGSGGDWRIDDVYVDPWRK